MTATAATLLAAESARRDLLVAADFDGLADILHADLSYVHLDGRRQDRAAYLEHVGRDFRMVDIEWSGPRVRVVGQTGLIDGTIVNCLTPSLDPSGPVRRFPAAALLVWTYDSAWRLVAYQGTRIG